MITIFLNNYVQTYSNQVHTQNLSYNYTIIIYTNLNINLYSSLHIQISETMFPKFMINLTQIYDKFRKKHIYHKSAKFIIKKSSTT